MDLQDRLVPLHEQLAKHDFAVGDDAVLGLTPTARRRIGALFGAGALEGDLPAVHKDRDRARDVVRYRWLGNTLSVRPHDVVEIRNRSGFTGSRAHKRIDALSCPALAQWVGGVLHLVPPQSRQDEGTLGVNLFRTRTVVVDGPHQDDEEYVIVYVVAKRGRGAETTLHPVGDPDRVVFRKVLRPGQFVVFRDAAFLHSASPLRPGAAGRAERDAIVGTVNYHDTYPLGPG